MCRMIPSDYFNRPYAPAKNSPVGKLIRKMHAEFPHLELATSRIEAGETLRGIGGAARIRDAYKRWLQARSSVRNTRKARFSSVGKACTPGASIETAVSVKLDRELADGVR